MASSSSTHPKAATAAAPTASSGSADTSPVALRSISGSEGPRHQGLRPAAPIPTRTSFCPDTDFATPPAHLSNLTLSWANLSRATQLELSGISPDQAARSMELARANERARTEEANQRALERLLQRQAVLSSSEDEARQEQAKHDSSAAAARHTAEIHDGKAKEYKSRRQIVAAQRQTIAAEIPLQHYSEEGYNI